LALAEGPSGADLVERVEALQQAVTLNEVGPTCYPQMLLSPKSLIKTTKGRRGSWNIENL